MVTINISIGGRMSIEQAISSTQRRMAQVKGMEQGLANRIYHWKMEFTFGSDEGYEITFEKAEEEVIDFL